MMQRLISITLVTTLVADHVLTQNGDREHHGPQTCGGRLLAPVGVIQTPNFPHPFPVPIKCRWIIENSIVNGTISIYFTQQYTTSGLTFTEYLYYDDTFKAGESKALTVTDENITRVKWLQDMASSQYNFAIRYMNGRIKDDNNFRSSLEDYMTKIVKLVNKVNKSS